MGIMRRGIGGAVLSAAVMMIAVLPAFAVTAGWRIVYHLPVQNGSTDTVAAITATGARDAWAAGGRLAVVNGQAAGRAGDVPLERDFVGPPSHSTKTPETNARKG